MSDQFDQRKWNNDDIAAELSKMTVADAREPALWEKAIEQAEDEPEQRVRRFPLMPIGVGAAALVLIAGGVFVGNTVLLEPRQRSGVLAGAAEDRALQQDTLLPESMISLPQPGGRLAYDYAESAPAARMAVADFAAESQVATDEDAEQERLVARDAQISIYVDDVRSAADTIAGLIDVSQTEFLETKTVNGEGGDATGYLRLRVLDERLEDVLDQIGLLGTISSSSISAQDLTDSIFDTEARLRNERRVEDELLELLETRERANLGDILNVRRELNRVRQNIERMDAQRQNMRRRVTLATLNVNLSGIDSGPVASEPSGFAAFLRDLGDAFGDGIAGIGDKVLWLVRTVVSNIILIVIVVVGLLIGRGWWKRRKLSERG